MRSARALVVGVAAALLLAGREDVQQQSALEALQPYLRSLPADAGYVSARPSACRARASGS